MDAAAAAGAAADVGLHFDTTARVSRVVYTLFAVDERAV